MKAGIRRGLVVATVAALGLTGVGLTGTAATATGLESRLASRTVLGPVGLTADQWRQVAAASERVGDHAGAAAARQMVARSSGGTQVQFLWSVAKAAAKAVLKNARHLVPARIRPYADKILDVLETYDNLKETAIFGALVNAGLPPDLARYTAQWIATFS